MVEYLTLALYNRGMNISSANNQLPLHHQICQLILQHLPEAKLIYLFGSVAANRQTATSDIDIAVHCDRKLDPIERWDIAAELANSLGKSVDLVDLIEASTVMCNQITSKGICLYDPTNYANEYTMIVMSMYQNLNFERQEILSRFRSVKNG